MVELDNELDNELDGELDGELDDELYLASSLAVAAECSASSKD